MSGEGEVLDPLTGVRTPHSLTYMNTTTAKIITDGDAIDMWATESTEIVASKLRECMVLMDPTLGVPAAWLDHRVPSTRNSGNVTFLAHNLETGGLMTVSIHANAAISVLA